MNQIVKLKRGGGVPTAAPEPQQTIISPAGPPSSTERLFDFIGRAIADASIPADKLEILVRLEREMVIDRRLLDYQHHMAIAQSEMEPIVRDSRNQATNSWFASLDKIDRAIRPIYTRHGFYLSFSEDAPEGADRVIACKVSAHGHTEVHRLRAPLDMLGPKGAPNKTPLHGLGSTVSYLRRYLKCMIFDLALTNDDNDGNRLRYEGSAQDHGELAGQSEADELYALLLECSLSPLPEAERAFLGKMGLGHLPSLKAVPAGDFPRLKNALIGKLTRLRAANNSAGAR